MAQPILSGDQITLDEGIGHALRQGAQTGVITDAQVSASTTNAGLQALVAGFSGATELMPYVKLINRALTLGLYDGSCSDTNVNAATTVALLVANTYSQAGKIGPVGEFV
jgi:hypothetical protein